MKISFVFIMSVVLCYSCNQVKTEGTKNVVVGEDTVAEVDVAITKLDQIAELTEEPKQEQKLIFTAHGSEPGWMAQFYNNKLRVLANYGKDSVIINDDFSALIEAKDYNYNKSVTINGQSSNLIITIQNKSCVSEASGDKEDKKVLMNFNSKTYSGCGSFNK